MTLNDLLEGTVLDDIRRCEFVILGSHSVENYFIQNHDTIKLLYDKGILTDKNLDFLLVSKVVDEARKYVKMMNTPLTLIPSGQSIQDHTYADHVFRTDFLAYAIENEGLSPREIRKIRFDHDHNPVSFVLRYRKPDLIPNLRRELLDPKPKVVLGAYDEHPTCSDVSH